MAVFYQKFEELLAEIEKDEQYLPILKENGFDDWETLTYLKQEELSKIGITDDIDQKQILACVSAVQTMIEEVLREREESKENEGTVAESIPKIEKSVTEKMLLKGTSFKKERNETQQKFLARVTHLQLNDKEITKIDKLELCPKLQTLFLYNNLIEKIEGLNSLRNLQYLYIQDNQITKLGGFQGLKRLRSLNLEKNQITLVEGLEHLENLEELYLSDQKIGDAELKFDPKSMAMVADRLRVIECNNNNVRDISSFAYLSVLGRLSLRNNQIQAVEDVERVLACLNYITDFDLRENPIEKIPKIRDQIVMMSPSLEQFNDKKILQNERTFLLRFYNIKGGRGVPKTNQGGTKNKENKNLGVLGSNFQSDTFNDTQDTKKRWDGLNKGSNLHGHAPHSVSKKIFN